MLHDYTPTNTTGGTGSWSGLQRQRLTSNEIEDTRDAFELAKTDYQYYEALLISLIDDGKTDDVIYDINNSSSEDIIYLRNYLMGLSPYLSDTSFREASKMNILPNSILFEILSMNPDLCKDMNLLTYLETKDNPFPQWMLTYLQDSSIAITERTALEFSIEIYHRQMMQASSDLTMDMLYEQDTLDHEVYNERLKALNDPEADYMLADHYVTLGNFSKAEDVMSEVATKYDLKGKQKDDYNSELSFITWKIEVLSDSGRLDSLSIAQLQALEDIAEAGTAIGNMKARNIINFFYDGEYETYPEIPLDSANQRRMKTIHSLTSKTNQEKECIKVYPNPTKDIVYFEFNKPCFNETANLKITNMSGTLIFGKIIPSKTTKEMIDASTWASGSYQYELKCDGGNSLSGKFIVIK